MAAALEFKEAVQPGIAYCAIAEGEPCGDQYTIKDLGDETLFAVIDGAGHGRAANAVARKCVQEIQAMKHRDIQWMFDHIHHALQRSRGCALSIVLFHASRRQVIWAGVGDVDAMIITGRAPEKCFVLLQQPGVVGVRLPKLRPQAFTIEPGARLVMATDGIRRGFASEIDTQISESAAAHALLNMHRTGKDDALVLVAGLNAPQGQPSS